MDDEIKLLPCPNPWCESHQHEGGGPVAPDDIWNHEGSNRLRVGCHFCSMMGPHRDTEAEAIAAWNTRPSRPTASPNAGLADPWGDEVSALVDAAFETVSRNPSDHETALAYRRAILAALRQQPSPADEVMVLLREAINDGIATLAAVRATAASDEWADSAAHFHNLCGQTIRRMNAALSPPTEGER